jgi:hypothetical protein
MYLKYSSLLSKIEADDGLWVSRCRCGNLVSFWNILDKPFVYSASVATLKALFFESYGHERLNVIMDSVLYHSLPQEQMDVE